MATTSTTWSAPGAYSTARPYTLGAMYSPYIAGAELWTATRANDNATSVTVTCVYGYGFGTGSISSSYTGYTVTATISGGMSASATISTGTWERTGSTARTLVSGISQTGYDQLKQGTISGTISNWTSGSKSFTMTIKQASGTTTSHMVTLACPTYNPTVTIIYKSNGGTGTMNNTTYTYASSGATYLRPNTFTPPMGHYFYGWHRTQSQATAGNREYSDGVAWSLSNPGPTYTLYAAWRPNTYTVRYNANGGTGSINDGTPTYSQDFTASNNTFVKTGYHFVSWTTQDDSGNTDSWLANETRRWTYLENKTFYANWEPDVYTITLHKNGATTAGTTKYYQKYNTGIYSNSGCTTTLNHITCPTKRGCTFLGYFTSTGTTPIIDAAGNFIPNITTAFTADTTLVARWQEQTCTVHFYYLNSNNSIQHITKTVGVLSSGSLTADMSVPNYYPYEFSGKWRLITSPPSSGSLSSFTYTDLVIDNYISPYNFTHYIPYSTTSVAGMLKPGKTLHYSAVYKRPLNNLTTTEYNQYALIRYTPVTGVGEWNFDRLVESLDTGLTTIEEKNDESGTSLFGVLQFSCGLDYTSIPLRNLRGNNVAKQGLHPINASILQIPELTGTTNVQTQTKIVNNLVYVVFQIDNIDSASSYTLYITLSNSVVNDFNVPTPYSAKLVSQGMNFIVDINANGTMMSMGGVSYDDLSSNNSNIRPYTPTPPTRDAAQYYGNDEDAHRNQATRITALYNSIYVANPSGSYKVIPALTEGRIEDEVVMTPNTLGNWGAILSGGSVPPSEVTVLPITITQNGTYTAPVGQAYSPVTVSVSEGASAEYINGILVVN